MITKLLGVATLFAAGTLLTGAAPTLGATDPSTTQAQSSTTSAIWRWCARRVCGSLCSTGRCGGGGHRCGHGHGHPRPGPRLVLDSPGASQDDAS